MERIVNPLDEIRAETARLAAANKSWVKNSAVVPFVLGIVLFCAAYGLASVILR